MAKVNRKATDSYQFTLILAGIKDLTPDVTDALYEAGFDDALVGMAAGVPYIDVNHRRAESLEKAVREAIRDVEKAGFHVVRVESDTANAITRINADLLTPMAFLNGANRAAQIAVAEPTAEADRGRHPGFPSFNGPCRRPRQLSRALN